MERPIKGGYILISLGLIALSTSYSGSIDYDRISKTKKHIVLTGIKIATTVMPDIAVKPIYGNGTITFEDVYGFDVVISSNNSVSVSEHVAPSGGTQLNEVDCNYGSSYDDIITIVGIGDFFNFETPSIDYFKTTNISILKVIHNGKLVKSLSVDNPSGYIQVNSVLTITYEDSTTATLTVTQIKYMNDGYTPL